MTQWPVIIHHKIQLKKYLETNTNVFPIPQIGSTLEIASTVDNLREGDIATHHLRVVAVEYYFDRDTGEKYIYVVVEEAA